MALKDLHRSRSGRELRRRSTLELLTLSPPTREDHPTRGTVSAEFQPRDRPVTAGARVSDDDVQRSSSFVDSPTTTLGPSRPSFDSTWSRPFNLYKWRHASESQLSAKARRQRDQNLPPVPALPLEPPLIITTGPTMGPSSEVSSQAERRKSRFVVFPRAKSPGAPVPDPSKEKKNTDKKAQKDKRKTMMFGSLRSSTSKDSTDDPQRGAQSLDINALMAAERPSDATDTLAPPSSGRLTPARSNEEQPSLASLFDSSPKRPKATQAKTWLPRKRKNRESLFPMPAKVTPPQFPNTAPATPRASTSAVSSSGSPHRSPGGESSPPLTSLRRTSTTDGVSHPSLPAPHQTLAATSIAFAAPASTLFRNDSTSARSDRSTHALAPPLSHRPSRKRANTLGSKSVRSEDGPMPPPTPPITGGGSGRNSTSTAGRSSFSNLLTLSHRFRNGSDPHSSRQHSPGLGVNGGNSGLHSQSNSFSISREALRVTLPDREEGESAGKYLTRVEDCVDRSQIPSVLSKQHDEFFLTVMRSFMRKFAFFGDPLDMAIRKLLMEVDLPKETQQIDRFLQSFADRYHECNPGIFVNAEKAYFIAFSILILQTDAFNRNNKRKMTKLDYKKNSSIDGISNDVLDCFYDNIVYTPFIRVEDEIELQSSIRKNKKTLRKQGTVEQLKTAAKASEPLDPYALILEGKLDILRPPLKDVMNLDDPYSYVGTSSKLDLRHLNKNSKCGILQIESLRSRPDAFLSPTTIDNPEDARSGLVDLPVDKVGTLWRKDPKKKAARSPWQEWGAILTGSGLSFFKNAGWVKNLMHQYDAHKKHGHTEGSCIFRPPIQMFKPDYSLPTEKAVALHDSAYKRHKNAFIFFSPSGTEEVLLADSENDMNDWLAKINHQASYRTAGIRPRGLVGGNYEGQRQRALRRLQSSNSTRTIQTPTGEVTIQSGNIDFLLAQQISAARREGMKQKIDELEDQLGNLIKQLDGQLRDARHLLVLAPIQQKTRESLVHVAGKMAAQLKWIRIELWRMKCHRDILALDLDEENKLAGSTPGQRSSPQLQPQSSPHLSSMPSNEKLARGLPHLSTPVSPSTEADSQLPPVAPAPSVRPRTKETHSSRETELSDEDDYATPPENTPQRSPALLPENRESDQSARRPSVPRESSSISHGTLSPRSEPNAAYASSIASSLHEFPDTTIDSEFSTPNGDEKEMDAWKPLSNQTDGSRPGTASDSEADHGATAASPESRSKGVRRSLHRSLRDGTPIGHRSHRRGKDSGSSVLSDNTRIGSPESEGLSRAKGSFTVHGKKASVITFGSEWQEMSAEEKFKLRKQAQLGDNTPTVPMAVEDDLEPSSSASASASASAPVLPLQHRDARATSISTYQSSVGARRHSNATSISELRSDGQSLQERRAAKKHAHQASADVAEDGPESALQDSSASHRVNSSQHSNATDQEHEIQRTVSPQQAVEA